MAKIIFIIGGNRSGKSRYALDLVKDRARVYYIASAEPKDEEMARRIARHKASRSEKFITIEEPVALSQALDQIPDTQEPVIWDCVTLYLANLVAHYERDYPERERLEEKILDHGRELLTQIIKRKNPFIIISNELGEGIIPTTPLGRFFVDLQGLINQQIAQAAHRVVKMEAGIPLVLKEKRWSGRLGTTSYVYPAGIVENVKRLLGKVQDIELVFFEDPQQTNLLTPEELDRLLLLTYERDLTFTVHFPLDLMLGGNERERELAIDSVTKVWQLSLPLKPRSYILHLPIVKSAIPTERIELDRPSRETWLARIERSICSLLSRDIDPDLLCLENLSYPFHYLDGLLEKYGLSVCLDVGHLLRYRYSLPDFLSRYYERIQVIHLHNSTEEQDHKGLVPPLSEEQEYLLRYLEEKDYRGILTLEVFNEEDFLRSYELVKAFLYGI